MLHLSFILLHTGHILGINWEVSEQGGCEKQLWVWCLAQGHFSSALVLRSLQTEPLLPEHSVPASCPGRSSAGPIRAPRCSLSKYCSVFFFFVFFSITGCWSLPPSSKSPNISHVNRMSAHSSKHESDLSSQLCWAAEAGRSTHLIIETFPLLNFSF